MYHSRKPFASHLFVLVLMAAAIWPARCLSQTPASSPSETFAQRLPLGLQDAIPPSREVAKFGRFQLTLHLTATYESPFDPDQVLVRALFTSPKGRTYQVEGYLDQDFTRRLENNKEVLVPVGDPVWRVRFTPDETGSWRYRVSARDRTGEVSLPEQRFQVSRSSLPGFIRRSLRNPAVFAYDNERPFFAVGENMGWAGPRGSSEYETWLKSLGAAGGNWVRIWMSSWNCGLEWTAEPHGDWRLGNYHGLGVYSLDNAWKLDTILDQAQANGIAVQLCFGTYGEFRSGGFFNEGEWKANPYNIANGGPCRTPDEFWTNETARKIYRQRLRYIMARYGSRTNIQAWEFWNEANPPASWVGEMARYLKGTGEFTLHPADPYDHLVTTTYGSDAIWKIPEIDITETHSYGTGNVPDYGPVADVDARQFASYGKPHLMGEFGIDWRDSDSKYDPAGQGINLHNAIWSAAMSGDAGSAMIWWWDSYIDPERLYPQFAALHRFTDTVPWTAGPWKPATVDPPVQVGGAETFTDLVIPEEEWVKPSVTDFTPGPNGLPAGVRLPLQLFGPAKSEMQAPLHFHLHAPGPTRFVVHVSAVSDRGRLRFLLDGQPAGQFDFSAGPPADPSATPDYVTTVYHLEWKIYQAVFDRDYGIDVPAGDHTVTVENTAGDWLTMERIVIPGYRSSLQPDVHLYGLVHDRDAVLWIQNAVSNWKSAYEKRTVPVLSNLQTVVHDLPRGRYKVEWWDTHEGRVIRTDRISTSRAGTGDGLQLKLPVLSTDLAVRISKG